MNRTKKKNNKSRQFISSAFVVVLILCCFSILFNKCQPPEGMRPSIKITCRDYLLLGKNEGSEYGLYSYVLIRREAQNSLEHNRYLMLWRAYRGAFRKYEEYISYEIAKENANITYWPLRVNSKTSIPNEYKKENEAFFIDTFDYARANVILSKIPDMNTPGPFIVTYHYPLGNMMPQIPDKKEILIIDLSRIDERLFSDILDLFQKKVKDTPKTWQNKFDWELIRIHFDSALRIHGEPVLYAAEWVGEFFGGFKQAFAAPSR